MIAATKIAAPNETAKRNLLKDVKVSEKVISGGESHLQESSFSAIFVPG